MPRHVLTRRLAGAAAWQWLSLLGAAVLLVLAFVLSSSSQANVANVDGQQVPITTFNRWMLASAASGHSSSSVLPGFIPDAPQYSRCVAFERSAAPKSTATVSDATLRKGCAAYRTTLAESTMQFLISGKWLLDQAAREHVSVTPAQVQAQTQKSFSSSGGLVHFLTSSHLSRADLAYEARIALVAQGLNARHAGATPTITATQISSYYTTNHTSFGTATLAQATAFIRQLLIAQAQAPAINAYLQRLQRFYQPRTTCAPGYRLALYCHVG
ncbi:MAG: hypothetical protein ACYDHH_33605 [Solirubrobacteraceae bacterium]